MISAVCVRLMSLASPTFETLLQRAGFLILGQSESEAKVAVVRLSYRAVFRTRTCDSLGAKVLRLSTLSCSKVTMRAFEATDASAPRYALHKIVTM